MQKTSRPKGIAREAQRCELTGVPTSTWYDLQNAGLAPKPIPLGPRARGWLIEELEEWVAQRRAERDRGDVPNYHDSRGRWSSLGEAATRVVSMLETKL